MILRNIYCVSQPNLAALFLSTVAITPIPFAIFGVIVTRRQPSLASSLSAASHSLTLRVRTLYSYISASPSSVVIAYILPYFPHNYHYKPPKIPACGVPPVMETGSPQLISSRMVLLPRSRATTPVRQISRI